VAGGEQGGELVAQLLAARVRRLEDGEQRALGVVAVDPLVEQRVEPAHAAQVRGVRPATLVAPQAHGQQQRHRDLERPADRVAQLRVAAAEHHAQDHLERDRLHPLERLQRAAGRPARELLVGGAGHRLAPAGQRLAVEGRQHELALAHVLLAVEHEDRARAGERLQERGARARVELRRVGGVDALDLRRVRGEDHRPVRPREPERERLAVARLGAAHERGRPRDPLVGLERGRLAGPGRQHGTHLPAPPPHGSSGTHLPLPLY
jgi:hypothetical protein